MRAELKAFVVALIIFNSACTAAAAEPWQIGTPITTYYAGPSINDNEAVAKQMAEGMLLGYFGKAGRAAGPTHVLVVNLNYKSAVTTTVVGPDRLYLFDAVTRKWTRATGSRGVITLPPGGGKLIRVQR